MTPHRLIVVRHAKAEAWGPSDRERELAPRGRADAADAGRWLAGQGLTPDLALVSGAVRTRQTWAAMSEAAGWSLEPVDDDNLYTAGPETALDILREADPDAGTVLVIGHNPTMAYLVQLLDDGTGAGTGAEELTGDFPTSAVAVFEYDGAWADLDLGSARLEIVHVGRG